jgi:hypothetical protein
MAKLSTTCGYRSIKKTLQIVNLRAQCIFVPGLNTRCREIAGSGIGVKQNAYKKVSVQRGVHGLAGTA